jgi:hypothetical protein
MLLKLGQFRHDLSQVVDDLVSNQGAVRIADRITRRTACCCCVDRPNDTPAVRIFLARAALWRMRAGDVEVSPVGCRSFSIELARGRSQHDAFAVHCIPIVTDSGVAALDALVEHDETEARFA